jgi:perosamine synthetase
MNLIAERAPQTPAAANAAAPPAAPIPLVRPYFGRHAARYYQECLDSGWVSSKGRFIAEFEHAFADFNGSRHALAVSNATVALHLALVAMGIGPGDEVIVPALTFAATINVVLHAGATPVIVDIDPDTWNIAPAAIRAAITPRTRAIIPVHLYGYPAEMPAILEIAAQHKLQVLEDAAEAHGAQYGGRRVGAFGRAGVFSFYGNKIITTGEGGIVVTDDDALYQRMLVLRDHGMSRDTRYLHTEVGYNYRMTNPQAALGLAQMEEAQAILASRDAVFNAYERELADAAAVGRRRVPAHLRAVNWIYTCLVPRRDALIDTLAAAQVETRPMFVPLHMMDIYKAYRRQPCPHAEAVAALGISLPTFHAMDDASVARVCALLKAECAGGR